MKRVLNRHNLINLIVITIISLILAKLSSNYTIVLDMDYDDIVFSILLVMQYIIWLMLVSMLFSGTTTYRFVQVGLIILYSAAFSDLLDEFYDVGGMIAYTETLGEIVGMFIITVGLLIYYKRNIEKIHQITALKNKYYEESIRDNMTGLYNKSYYYNYFSGIIKDLDFYKDNNYLLVMDLDNFKNINDNFGHNTGDKIIRIVGNAIITVIQNSNHIPFRYGGDEFIIIFRDITFPEIEEIVHQIRDNVSKVLGTTVISNGEKIQAKFSIGITLQRDDDTPETLFKRADEYMYRAKGQGKDSVITDKFNTTKK